MYWPLIPIAIVLLGLSASLLSPPLVVEQDTSAAEERVKKILEKCPRNPEMIYSDELENTQTCVKCHKGGAND